LVQCRHRPGSASRLLVLILEEIIMFHKKRIG
jgi:hypothetical protein